MLTIDEMLAQLPQPGADTSVPTPAPNPGVAGVAGTPSTSAPGASLSPDPLIQSAPALAPPPVATETPTIDAIAAAPNVAPASPAAAAPQPLEPAAVAPTPQPTPEPGKSIDDMLGELDTAQADRHGPVMNYVKGFLKGLASKMAGYQGASLAVGLGRQMADMTGLNAVLGQFGQRWLESKDRKPIDADKVLAAVGIEPPDPGLMGNIGKNTFDALMTFGAIQVAVERSLAPPLVAAGTSALARTGVAIADAMQRSPWLGIVGTVTSEPGSTLGAEVGPGWAMAGGIGSQMAINPVVGTAKLIGKGVTAIARPLAGKVADAIDKISVWAGLVDEQTVAGTKTWGQKPVAPASPATDLIEGYRTAESKARAAGDNVVATAAANREAQGMDFETQHTAWMRLENAKRAEAYAVTQAERALNKLPADLRGRYSRQAEAIRSQFAEPQYTREFTETQIADHKAQVEGKIQSALNGVEPTEPGLTGGQWSERVQQALLAARKMSENIRTNYYNRVPLKETQMPSRENPQRDLDGLVKDWKTRFADADIPYDQVSTFRRLFAKGDILPDGSFKPKKMPTALKVYAEIQALDDMRAQAKNLGKNKQWGAMLTALEHTANGWLEAALPNNVPMQQARAYSRLHGQLFYDSEIGGILATKGKGTALKVRPEDAFGRLLKREHGVEDVYNVVNKMLEHNRVGIPMREEPYLTQGEIDRTRLNPKQQDTLLRLQSDTENAIRKEFQDAVTETGTDPAQISKVIARWQPRVQAFARASGAVDEAMDAALKGLAKRQAIEQSALAKYLESKTPSKAIDKLWNSPNPAATARSLITGEAGVGGFAKDPRALEGFRQSVTDRLIRATSRDGTPDPHAMKVFLEKSPEHDRMLRTVLGKDRYDRLTTAMDRSIAAIENPDRARWQENIIWAARIGAVKFSALLPQFGKGGNLQQAAILSEIAKRKVTQMLQGKTDTITLFGEAIRDPNVERLLLEKVPTDVKELKSSAQTLRRVARMNAGLTAVYDSAESDRKGDGPRAPAATSSDPLYWMTANKNNIYSGNFMSAGHKINETLSFDPGDTSTDYTISKGDAERYANYGKIGMRKDWGEEYDTRPNPNIEDRRVSDKTLGGYASLISSYDKAGYSQFKPRSLEGHELPGWEHGGFLQRSPGHTGPTMAPPPTPRPNPFRPRP